MKLLLPLLTEIGIQTGFGIRNPQKILSLEKEPVVLIQLWRDFQLLHKKIITFSGKDSLRIFLNEIFTDQEISEAGLATLEFDQASFPIENQKNLFKKSSEAQVIFRNPRNKNSASLLYDFLPDRKMGHTYSPILHCAHAAFITEQCDSFAVLANFRPPYLKAESSSQEMAVQLKSPTGDLLKQKNISLPFNSTNLISFRNEFQDVGGFKPGCTMNFKGGASQFAIFTVFFNQQTGALGIEHSLAPFYYCAGVMDSESRKTFYKNAFSDLRN